MMRRVMASFAAMTTFAACDRVTGPGLPAGAVPMEPLAVYADWWSMTQECSALGGDLGRVAWYVVPGVKAISYGGLRNVEGIWLDGNRIVLAEGSVRNGQLVRHEMLHALLRDGSHPRASFASRCGGIVACEEGCLAEESPPAPDPNAVPVDASVLEISVSVAPASPGSDLLDGYVQITVSARNPLYRPVIVELAEPSDGGAAVAFRCRMAGAGTSWWWDRRAFAEESIRFAPGETKRQVYDYWIYRSDGSRAFPAGTYEIRGAYGDNWAARPVQVTIRQ
jgi:hypothetical protein